MIRLRSSGLRYILFASVFLAGCTLAPSRGDDGQTPQHATLSDRERLGTGDRGWDTTFHHRHGKGAGKDREGLALARKLHP